eukprot:423354-Amphidinium_carterae.1
MQYRSAPTKHPENEWFNFQGRPWGVIFAKPTFFRLKFRTPFDGPRAFLQNESRLGSNIWNNGPVLVSCAGVA